MDIDTLARVRNFEIKIMRELISYIESSACTLEESCYQLIRISSHILFAHSNVKEEELERLIRNSTADGKCGAIYAKGWKEVT